MFKSLATRFEDLRIENRLTQVAAADYLGISKQQVNSIERGKSSVPLFRLVEIADFFDVSLDYLIGRSPRKEWRNSPTNAAESKEIRNFATRLQFLRQHNHLTQPELADYINSCKQYICDFEKGRRVPSVKLLVVIADFFGVSLDYIVGRSDDPTLHK